MRILDDVVIVSPTDLTAFLACRHATRLDAAVARGQLAAPATGADEVLESLFTKGREHEDAYLQSLRDRGLRVVTIEADHRSVAGLRGAESSTVDAMAGGADVIYQATFFDGQWVGHADFLLRRDGRPGKWKWSYDVADTKFARRLKVPALLQMAIYAERLSTLQGIAPEQLIVVTGDRREHRYAYADCAAYARRVRAEFLDFLASDPIGVDDARPEPNVHCAQCRWQPRCDEGWHARDDLSLVAFMRGDHSRALRLAGIDTVRALAAHDADELPSTIGESSRRRLVGQARLQLAERETEGSHYDVLPAEPARGLGLLPEPSAGDVFFDMEGDPLFGEHGLEYLFGVVQGDEFTAYWATDPVDEKAAFEALVDHLIRAWDADPQTHVYHYAPYEPSRLKSLSGRYDTRADDVDRLLRGGRLIDLYAVVRQGLRLSKESYSIKKVEDFYWSGNREGAEVSNAMGSVVAFEQWLSTRDNTLLDDIASYNEDDCRSTKALRNWLESLRSEAGGDDVFGRPDHGDGAASEAAEQAAAEVSRLADALREGVPDDNRSEQEQARWLLAGLLDWHRREARPEWWEYYRRLELTDEQLVEDSAALGLLGTAVAVREEKRSTVWELPFPPQDTKISLGRDARDPTTEKSPGDIVRVNAERGVLRVKRANTSGPPDCTALVPGPPLADTAHRERLRELGAWVLEHGIDSPDAEWRAARDLLLRRPPRCDVDAGAELRAPDESGAAAVSRIACALDHGVLPVQGPPGTGKTWAGARMVLDLVRSGQQVGITAFSHKAITNLLDAVCAAADERGQPVQILQKATASQGSSCRQVELAGSAKDVAARAGSVDIVAGTTWLFTRPDMSSSVDTLVVDEAGQLSLANVLAVSGASKSVVLLGDPQQLAQPVKGQHPAGAEASALEHLLGDATTVAPDRGLLLDSTWRMHPSIAAFVSDTFYKGQLRAQPDCARQRVESASALGGAGLRWIPVEHVGNTAASTEEADVVARLCADVLTDGSWTDSAGLTRPLTGADILVVTPFNAQIARLRSRIDAVSADIAVGTVDKFQGQEAPIVLYSTASSTADAAPRGMDFLYSLNRFNVAISRARGVAAVVGSPALLAPVIRTAEQLHRVNALCAFAASVSDETDG